MDPAEAPKEFSLEDPIIHAVRTWARIHATAGFLEEWLARSPIPLMVFTIHTEPPLKIHRHHLEMLIAHMRLQGEA